MRLHTASEVVSLAHQLESSAAEFYQGQAASADAAVFRMFSEENRRNETFLDRAYYGAATDALEGGFTFDLESSDYALIHGPAPNRHAVLETAVEIERRTMQFYDDAAMQSLSFLGEVPRLFARLARRREMRIERLDALLARA